jgi:hypothetical protein
MTLSQNGEAWNPESISEAVEQVLSGLTPLIERFCLAKGTALALQLAHRRSRDLDLFSAEAMHVETWIQKLQGYPQFGVTAKSEDTLHCTIRGVKVSLLRYPYPLLFPLRRFQEVNVADARDIACMKIAAIAGRAARCDFVDLFYVARHQGLAPLPDLFQKKYALANYSLAHILKSLTYFEEAEQDPMPDMLRPAEWSEIRKFYEDEVPKENYII